MLEPVSDQLESTIIRELLLLFQSAGFRVFMFKVTVSPDYICLQIMSLDRAYCGLTTLDAEKSNVQPIKNEGDVQNRC